MRQRRSALGERQSFSHDDLAGTAVVKKAREMMTGQMRLAGTSVGPTQTLASP
jgi:hypothetical protein